MFQDPSNGNAPVYSFFKDFVIPLLRIFVREEKERAEKEATMRSLVWIDQCSRRFRNKDHYCPSCHTLLTRYETSKTLNKNSLEAQKPENAKLLGMARGTWGTVEFIWTEFECPACRNYWTADELEAIEEKNAPLAPKTRRRILGRVVFFILVLAWVYFQYRKT